MLFTHHFHITEHYELCSLHFLSFLQSYLPRLFELYQLPSGLEMFCQILTELNDVYTLTRGTYMTYKQ